MKRFYFLLAICLYAFSLQAQIVNIPDANFKAKLLQANESNGIARIEVWPPVNGSTLINTKIDTNNNGEIEESEAALIYALDVSNSNISSLEGINAFTGLGGVDCSYNQLTTLTLTTIGMNAGNLSVDCNNNLLTSIDFSDGIGYINLECSHNLLTGFDFSETNIYLSLQCSFNPITTIETGNFHGLLYLTCTNTPVTTVDISGNTGCEGMNLRYSNNLTKLMIKDAVDIDPDMGDTWYSFDFMDCPNLQYFCVSENRLAMAQNKLLGYGLTNCALNSYCDFNPGVPYFTISGNNKLDLDGNGCDAADSPYPNLRLNITNSIVTGTIPSFDGDYSVSVLSGTHIISPVFENPAYFIALPPSLTVNFPSQGSLVTQNFCIAPNGTHNDLEVTLLPLGVARPGFDSNYKIICKNKGTTAQSPTLNIAFDDAILDLVTSSPAATSSVNNLSWTLNNLLPFETREIVFILNVNSPTDTPSVNANDILHYTVTFSGATDETPSDNISAVNQLVRNSFDPNDKICLEGKAVGPESIGQYVHYIIHFENTGTFPAQNIVVKDIIDADKYDLSSLVPLHGSHPFMTRILTGNKVEFIFENINLPFDDANNDGYVAFKIKTKPTLAIGDTFSNSASIYFDYNFPVVTEPATTLIQLLGNPDFEFSHYFTLYPNPVKNVLNIKAKDGIELKSISIYNTLGQLLQTVTGNAASIDVSGLTTGNYIIKVASDKGMSTTKFIKE